MAPHPPFPNNKVLYPILPSQLSNAYIPRRTLGPVDLILTTVHENPKTFNTLLVDIFPAKPSTAAASGNITRCALSAGSVAAMQPLLDRLGQGWFFTLVGGIAGSSAALAIWAIRRKGMPWRKIRQGGGSGGPAAMKEGCKRSEKKTDSVKR